MKKILSIIFLLNLVVVTCASQTDIESTSDKTIKTHIGVFLGQSNTYLHGKWIDKFLFVPNGTPDGILAHRKAATFGILIKVDLHPNLYSKWGINYLSQGGKIINSRYRTTEPDVILNSINMPIVLGFGSSNVNPLKVSFEFGLGLNIETSTISSGLPGYNAPPFPTSAAPFDVEFKIPIDLLVAGNIEYQLDKRWSVMANYRAFKNSEPFFKSGGSSTRTKAFIAGSILSFGFMCSINPR